MMQVKINFEGQERIVTVKEPRREHKKKWWALMRAGSDEFETYEDKLVMELCEGFETEEKLDKLEIVELEKLNSAITSRMLAMKERFKDFTATSKGTQD